MQDKLPYSLIPPEVRGVASALKDARGRAYLVGGPVRDLILGKTPLDWDIATDLTPDRVLTVFPSATTVGIEFGRVQVFGIDVVSLRGESGYFDRRHPATVKFGVAVKEDLRRRDFTMNAMAAEFDDLFVVDPFGGREDLQRGLIRTVGDPRSRLSEDPLRILRAVRFRAVLGMQLDSSLSALLPELAASLSSVSGERVYAEMEKILLSPGAGQGIMDLRDYGLGAAVLPEVYGSGNDSLGIERIAAALSTSTPDPVTRWAILFAGRGCEAAQRAFGRLNVPAALRQSVCWLLRNAGSSESDSAYLVRRLVDAGGIEQVRRLADFERAIGLDSSSLAEGLKQVGSLASAVAPLALTGDDVMRMLGIDGPAIGEALSYLKDLVLRNPDINVRDALEGALRDWWRRR